MQCGSVARWAEGEEEVERELKASELNILCANEERMSLTAYRPSGVNAQEMRICRRMKRSVSERDERLHRHAVKKPPRSRTSREVE